MGLKIALAFCFLIGIKLLYGSFSKADIITETPIDNAWWQSLSEEWKSILLINQNFQQQGIDIFKLQTDYSNRLNAAGEADYSEMNRSLHDLSADKSFGLGYTDLYARALRKKIMVKNDSINLKTLDKLETVYMVNGPAELSPLKKLAHLKVLIINYCGIDVSVPFNREILDLEPLRNLKELRVLHCSSPALQSLSAIKDLTNLEELRCDNSNVTSLSPLKKLVNLKRLTIGSKIKDAAIISSFQNLEELTIDLAKQVPDLRKMKNLQKLCIAESEMAIVDKSYRINNIEFLSRLANLEYVDLKYTSYRGSLDALASLQHLKAITLPPVSQEAMLQFKKNHKNCIIINSYQYER